MNAMTRFDGSPGFKSWLAMAVLGTLLAGCGGGGSEDRDPILGGPGGNVSRPGRIQPAKWELPRGGTAYQCGLLLH